MLKALIASVSTIAILLWLPPAALGQLETRASFPVVYEPYLVAAGDFNHDGAQDVAVTAPTPAQRKFRVRTEHCYLVFCQTAQLFGADPPVVKEVTQDLKAA